MTRFKKWLGRPGTLVAIAFLANLSAVGAVWLEIRDRDATTSANRTTACFFQRGFVRSHNRLALELGGFDPDTGQPAAFLEFPPDRQDHVRARLPAHLVALRICDDESIAAFNASGGVQGVAPIDPTDDDFSEAVLP